MSALVWFVVGILLEWADQRLALPGSFRPDLRLLFLSFLLLRTDRAPMARRATALLLGLGAGSSSPFSAWLLAGSLTALLVLPLRGTLEVWHPVVQLLAVACGAGALLGVANLLAAIGESDSALRGAWSEPRGLLATAAAAVVVHPLLVGLSRLVPRFAIPSSPADRRFFREHGLGLPSREVDPLMLWHARRR